MGRRIWTHTELADLSNLYYRDKWTLKMLAEKYGTPVSTMQRRMDRNPLEPSARLARHKEICADTTKNGYCTRCGCLYTEEDLK